MSELREGPWAEPTEVSPRPASRRRPLPAFPLHPLLEGLTGTGNTQVPTLLAFSPDSITGNHPECEVGSAVTLCYYGTWARLAHHGAYGSQQALRALYPPAAPCSSSESPSDFLFAKLAIFGVATALIARWGQTLQNATGTGEPPTAREAATRPDHPAERLRALTDLNVQQLADVFDITRGAFYGWLNGTSPRGERESHLLEALKFVETAARQLKDTQTLKQWLLTPVAPGAETPLHLMKQRRWRALQGLLVRARTPSSFLPTPQPLSGTVRQLSPDALRLEAERLSPPPAREDLEEAGGQEGERPSGEP